MVYSNTNTNNSHCSPADRQYGSVDIDELLLMNADIHQSRDKRTCVISDNLFISKSCMYSRSAILSCDIYCVVGAPHAMVYAILWCVLCCGVHCVVLWCTLYCGVHCIVVYIV